MTLQIVKLVDKISQLEVSGVRIRDMDELQAPVNQRDCPILTPEPLNFVSNLVVTRDSTGIPSIAKKTVNYTLQYTFLYQPVGAGRELERYGDMVEKAYAIIDAIIEADNLTSGTDYDEVVDITPAAIVEFGPVPDPQGNQYIGCRLQFVITEFVN